MRGFGRGPGRGRGGGPGSRGGFLPMSPPGPPGPPSLPLGGPSGGPPSRRNHQQPDASLPPASWPETGFPTTFKVWHAPNHGMNFMSIGEQLGQPAYSAQMPVVTGSLAFYAGPPHSNGEPLGEANDSGLTRSSAIVKLPNGFQCNFVKSSKLDFGEDSSTFTVPVPGCGEEAFKWSRNPDGGHGLHDKLSGVWKLFRKDSDDGAPLAVFTDFDGPQAYELGTFEFVGEGASGQLGSVWATVAVLGVLKAKQKQLLKRIRKGVTMGL